MIDPRPVPSDADLYLRPVRFVDSPVGSPPGEAVRLAGGMCWFSAYELIVVAGGRRAGTRTIAASALDDLIATLSDRQARRLRAMVANLTAERVPLTLGPRTLRFDQPRVAGILNVTPDSFSDGGARGDDPAAAAAAGIEMAAAGAALVDVGGESTRPGAAPVWEGDEVARVVPVIERLAAAGTLVSVDTRKASVMEAALAAGAHLVNDVSALIWDDRALELVARTRAPVILMHSPDPAKGPHGGSGYGDVLTEVYDRLDDRLAAVVAAGVDRARLLVDPGIGFGKSLQDNLALLNGLALFHALGCPVMLGASRKRMIGALANAAPADARLGGSIALAVKGAAAGVQLIRVHDVVESVQALAVWRGMQDAALVAPG